MTPQTCGWVFHIASMESLPEREMPMAELNKVASAGAVVCVTRPMGIPVPLVSFLEVFVSRYGTAGFVSDRLLKFSGD
jgi:hypothetical protein